VNVYLKSCSALRRPNMVRPASPLEHSRFIQLRMAPYLDQEESRKEQEDSRDGPAKAIVYTLELGQHADREREAVDEDKLSEDQLFDRQRGCAFDPPRQQSRANLGDAEKARHPGSRSKLHVEQMRELVGYGEQCQSERGCDNRRYHHNSREAA